MSKAKLKRCFYLMTTESGIRQNNNMDEWMDRFVKQTQRKSEKCQIN